MKIGYPQIHADVRRLHNLCRCIGVSLIALRVILSSDDLDSMFLLLPVENRVVQITRTTIAANFNQVIN